MRSQLPVSERRACSVVGQPRATQRRPPKIRHDEAALTDAIVRLAKKYGRYGYRRVRQLLVDEGWRVSVKRVYRIWRREGLKVPKKQPKRGRLWLNDGSCIRLRPERPNHVWSYDFVQDRTQDGRPIRMLTVIDEFTRRCLAIVVARRLRSDDVLQCLTDLFVAHGPPEHIRSDNGPEFVACNVRGWLGRIGVKTLYIEPAAHGRMAIARASTPSSVTSCSNASSSQRSTRLRFSSSAGAVITMRSGLTPRSAIDRRLQKRSCRQHLNSAYAPLRPAQMLAISGRVLT